MIGTQIGSAPSCCIGIERGSDLVLLQDLLGPWRKSRSVCGGIASPSMIGKGRECPFRRISSGTTREGSDQRILHPSSSNAC